MSVFNRAEQSNLRTEHLLSKQIADHTYPVTEHRHTDFGIQCLDHKQLQDLCFGICNQLRRNVSRFQPSALDRRLEPNRIPRSQRTITGCRKRCLHQASPQKQPVQYVFEPTARSGTAINTAFACSLEIAHWCSVCGRCVDGFGKEGSPVTNDSFDDERRIPYPTQWLPY